MPTNLLQTSKVITADSISQLYNQLQSNLTVAENPTPQVIKEEKAIYDNNFSQEMLQKLLVSGFSKQTIAKELKTSVTTINRILQGEIANPRPQIFSRLLGLYCLKCYS